MTHRLEGTSVTVLDRLRAALTPETRSYLHGLTPAVMTALLAFGLLNDTTVALVGGAVVATLDLLLALIHSTSTWRTALYGFAAAMQPIGIGFGWGSDNQWIAGLSVLAALLGSGVAAGKTPTPGF